MESYFVADFFLGFDRSEMRQVAECDHPAPHCHYALSTDSILSSELPLVYGCLYERGNQHLVLDRPKSLQQAGLSAVDHRSEFCFYPAQIYQYMFLYNMVYDSSH